MNEQVTLTNQISIFYLRLPVYTFFLAEFFSILHFNKFENINLFSLLSYSRRAARYGHISHHSIVITVYRSL